MASYSRHVSEDLDLILQTVVGGGRRLDDKRGPGPDRVHIGKGALRSPVHLLTFTRLKARRQPGIGMTQLELAAAESSCTVVGLGLAGLLQATDAGELCTWSNSAESKPEHIKPFNRRKLTFFHSFVLKFFRRYFWGSARGRAL